MKKYSLLLLLILCLSLTACNKKTDMKLRIKESSWSGWTEGYEPEERTDDYNVVLGKKYSINSGKFKFKITKINRKYIEIKTETPFSDKNDTVYLNSKKTKFKVYLEKELKLTTPTTDAGDIYYITLIK